MAVKQRVKEKTTLRVFDAVAEILRLRRELRELKEGVSHNARVWSGFRYIEISLIGAETLGDLIDTLALAFPQAFPNIDVVTVACFDSDYEMTRLLRNSGKDAGHAGFVRVPSDAFTPFFSNFDRPMLGRCDSSMQALLFPDFRDTLKSVAISPLVFQGKLIGSINQGSTQAKKFSPDAATDMLQHLTAVTAICIDNVMNRERLREDGLTDALTGLSNRRFFERRLQEEIKRWGRSNNELSCMLVDIDHFKQVNDRYGHQTGDRVLQHVAQVLGRDLRASDVLARYGGEEFVMLLPETGLRQAGDIAERLRERVAGLPLQRLGVDGNVTVSIGIAALGHTQDTDLDSAAWLVRHADTALYRAKQRGRNRVVLDGAQVNARDTSKEE